MEIINFIYFFMQSAVLTLLELIAFSLFYVIINFIKTIVENKTSWLLAV